MKDTIQVNSQHTDSYIATENTSHQNVIKNFYDDSTIFITGGTGFVGKVLVEKLLRSFENIKEINLLIRTKKGETSEIRLHNYLDDQVFDRVRRDFPQALKKIKPISGDVTKQNLGIDNINRQKLIDNVNIVFNSAASIKFNEPLTIALNINTLGAERVMDLCGKMVQLRSVVHVSTAYSHPTIAHTSTFDETIYHLESTQREDFLKWTKNLNTDFIKNIPDKFLKSHPNTYTLSKSLAEEVISNYNKKFPVCIVRPSVISASIEEPFPGFVDNYDGINGVSLAITRGLIRVIECDKNCSIDIIPVDVVVKQMIAAAWRTGTEITQNLQVYNCVSGSSNPLSFDELRFYLKKWSIKNPSEQVLFYPMLFYLTNPYLCTIFGYIFNKIPAIYLDTLLKLKGSKPVVLKAANKFLTLMDTLKYGFTKTFYFRDENSKKLLKLVANTMDGQKFSYDLNNLNWDTYMRNYVLGIRRYVSREDDSSLPEARKKLYMLFLKQVIFLSIFAATGTGLFLQFLSF